MSEEYTYEEFLTDLQREYPKPMFVYGEDVNLAERYKEEHADASIHGTPIGQALCVDDKARMYLIYMLRGVSIAYSQLTAVIMQNSLDAEFEYTKIFEELKAKESNDAGGT